MDGGILMETLNRPAVYKDKTAYMKHPECKLFLLRPFSTWGVSILAAISSDHIFTGYGDGCPVILSVCFHISNISISFAYARNLGWRLGAKDAKLCYRF